MKLSRRERPGIACAARWGSAGESFGCHDVRRPDEEYGARGQPDEARCGAPGDEPGHAGAAMSAGHDERSIQFFGEAGDG